MDTVRITAPLAADARLAFSVGARPHGYLFVQLQPGQGLPVRAQVDLGVDLADHMAAEALLPQLRRGTVVSVAGRALALRTEHGRPALAVLDAHSALVLHDPAAPGATAPAPIATTSLREDPRHAH